MCIDASVDACFDVCIDAYAGKHIEMDCLGEKLNAALSQSDVWNHVGQPIRNDDTSDSNWMCETSTVRYSVPRARPISSACVWTCVWACV